MLGLREQAVEIVSRRHLSIQINHRLNCDARKPLFDAEFDESLVLNRVTFILVLLSMSGPHFLKADIISPNSKVSSAEG